MQQYDQAIAAWPVPHDNRYVETWAGKTFVIASGERELPPLFLLHGACSNAVSWMGDIASFSRHFRTYAVDIPGDPGRSAPNQMPWNSNDYADWLRDVFDTLNIEKAAVLGLSQGGWNAVKFAVTYPEKVSKLVLLTPAGITGDRFSFLLRVVGYSLMGRQTALNAYVFGNDTIDPSALAFMDSVMKHYRSRIERLNLFTDDELKKLKMPVLLVGGNRDRIRNVSGIAQRLAKLIPDLESKVLPERGHVLVGIVPEVMPFLQKDR